VAKRTSGAIFRRRVLAWLAEIAGEAQHIAIFGDIFERERDFALAAGGVSRIGGNRNKINSSFNTVAVYVWYSPFYCEMPTCDNA